MYDVITIGGGPAGTAAAITAARHGAHVLLLERGRLPRHKVCGEFVSPESLHLLAALLSPDTALLERAPRLYGARLFLDGRQLRVPIDPAAASISRFDLDFALWHAAARAGVDARLQNRVQQVSGHGPFQVRMAQSCFEARSLIDASGRWSSLSQRLSPPPDGKWLGVKAHFYEQQTSPTVDLYFFNGGYCGVQPAGPDRVNVSAMVSSNVASALPAVLALHPALQRRSADWQPATDSVATSPLVFCQPAPLRAHVLLAGDAAGFVDPFVGDGIALALRSGVAAAESLLAFWRAEISLAAACSAYRQTYESAFLPVFRNARRFRRLLAMPAALRAPFVGLLAHTGLPRFVVRSTRGAL